MKRTILSLILCIALFVLLFGGVKGFISNQQTKGENQLLTNVTSGLPYEVFGGGWNTGHVQGIAIDDAREYIYYSFTTLLVKVNVASGEIEGTVLLPDSLHLGDLAFYEGKLYGSLSGLGGTPDIQYLAVFEPSDITEGSMEYSDVMQAVYLKEVVSDVQKNLYGMFCIDGVTFGTIPGDTSGKKYLFVAGCPDGVEANRTDKNYQVIYVYDMDTLDKNASGFDMDNPHKIGPEIYQKLFVYTGQHYSGPQTLTYDFDTEDIWLGMYAETAEGFPPYRLLAVDHAVKPVYQKLNLGDAPGAAYNEEATKGWVLTLKEVGTEDKATGIWGFAAIPHDVACGFASLGDDYFYVSCNSAGDGKQYSHAQLHYFNRETETFTRVSK